MMDQNLLNQLMAPIPGDHPGGEDISFSTQLDEIREARRQDDLSLAQGEWETELKTAQWPQVRRLCEELLINKSKDLQIACWYAEALCNIDGFRGLAFGLQVWEVLLTDFWEFLYPDLLEDGLDERAGKIEWLNKQLPMAVRNIPLTSKATGAYSWLKWDQSRGVDNLGLKDPAAREKAIADGKLTGEAFDKAAIATGLSYYENLLGDIREAATRLAAIEKHVDERFGDDSPGLKELRKAVADCDDVVVKIIGRLGGSTTLADAGQAAQPTRSDTAHHSIVAAVPAGTEASGPIRTRADAVRALRQVSQYFKQNEPHSPVALLAERAAKWAEMPLERWLASVIKDDSTLNQLRELLDIPREA
ncbi:MAG TPA: type VI secretion system protein TssA [Noviherbaspirillum sp.]|nr:type VI secretion system protein TssA [Noviherbaspirillum sp.]